MWQLARGRPTSDHSIRYSTIAVALFYLGLGLLECYDTLAKIDHESYSTRRVVVSSASLTHNTHLLTSVHRKLANAP
ncbi:MAG: hypothetical protein ACI95C_000656 [Pseudohongiellaceae bacterium]|jgi:hypothetical protein